MPVVSVILPNYNHAAFLQKRIDSILKQSFQDFELILLDDCSKDGSRIILEGLRNHPRVKHVLYNEKNSGSVFKQWAKGINLAIGKYTWIAESDDWAEPHFLENMVAEMGSDEHAGICFAGSNWVDDKGFSGKDLSIYFKSFSRNGSEEILSTLVKYNSIQNASAVLMNTSLAKKYIAGATRFKSCGDWFLYVNMLSESNLIFNSKKLNNFRWYHANISNSANKKGLWLSEGLRIIAFSRLVSLKLSRREIMDIVRYWRTKTGYTFFSTPRLFSWYLLTMTIFILRALSYRIRTS